MRCAMLSRQTFFFFASLDSEEAFGLHPYENNGFPEWSIAVYDS